MDKDKAIRSALLTAKGMDKTSENFADYVADLLRQGRASEVTDGLMAQADPQRLHHHYTTGNTGMDMPMDQASRMERAAQMGFDTGTPLYHGGRGDIAAFDPKKYGSGAGYAHGRTWATTEPEVAESFAKKNQKYTTKSNVTPILLKGENFDVAHQFVYGKGGGPIYNRPDVSDVEAQNIGPALFRWKQYVSDTAGEKNIKFRKAREPNSNVESDVYAIKNPTNIRSQFARFDPRLSHLSHLSASTGGAMELARAVVAKNRAGGQIAPSKYLPNVPRAVHADGGAANAPMFKGIHPELQGEGGAPLDLYHGTTQSKEFEAFDNAKLGARDAGFYGRGHYLTPLRGNAEGYADPDEMGRGAVIGPLHAALKNPYVWDVSSEAKSNSTLRDLQSMGIMREKKELNSWDNLQQHHIKPFMAEMQKRGHDGVVVKTGHEHLPNGISEVVAFNPNTIKHKDAEVFDPNDPRIRRDDGGRAGYADGGSPLGLYSKAAQIIRNQPQAKGNVDQLLAMVSKAKGVKPTELANAGRPAGDTMTKEELAQHFERALPDVQVTRKGRVARNALNALLQQDRRNWGQEDWDRANALNQEAERQPSSRYDQYTLPGGTNYREHLLHLPEGQGPLAKRRKELQDQWQQAYENQVPREELDRLGAEFDDLANDEGSDFKSAHWKTPNVLAHVRMDEHDNGKTLHVQEVQSDWGQEGREMGFHDPENKYEVFNKKTREVVSRHPDFSSMWDAYRTHPDSENLDYGDYSTEKPPHGPYVGNTQQWTDLALKHVLTEAAKNGNYDRVVFSPGEANADLYGQRKEVQMLKFLKSKDSGEAGILSAYSKDGRRSSEHEVGSHGELAKLIGKENATNLLAQNPTPEPDNGEDVYAHRLQGPLQVGGHGMVDYYKNYVHPGALKLLQQHDPSIKPESYDLPQGYKGFSLPMTDTARQSILKNGFQAFQRGGEVHKATGGPVMGYVPFAPIQIRQLAVAPIVPQQQQQTAGSFSKSLMSLMDTANEFKKKPDEPTSTSTPSEGHAPVQNGMSDVATAAYGKLADTWGQPIGVVSGYRDADKNQAVGGAKGSQHLHGNAYDIDTSDYSYEDRLRLADAAKAAGFTGFGFYGNNMHLDVGPQRAWGPSYHSDSIPDWARTWADENIYAAQPRATGGRIGKDNGGAMVGHHNTGPKGVEVASNIGGIPMPSMAISKVEHPLDTFGDVTLLAHPSMVTPSKETNVWSADTYTGRQPRGEEVFADPKVAYKAMQSDPNFGHMRDAGNWIDSKNNITDADDTMKMAQLGVARGLDPKGYSTFYDYVNDVRSKLGRSAYENDHMPGLRVYGDIKSVLYPKERFTPSGNRKKPVDYTLDAVMRQMKGSAEAGTEGWAKGAGNFRAVNTPKFLSMGDVKSGRGLIIPKEQMKPIKSDFEDAYSNLVEQLVKTRGRTGYQEYDAASDALTDIAKGRKYDWFGAVPPDLVAKVREFGRHASKMPTEYFEAKSKKAIPLSAFPAALVPKEQPETARRLTEAGVKKVLTYGSPEERIAMYKSNPDLMFSSGGNVSKALSVTRGFTKDGKSAIGSLKPKGK